LKLSRAALLIFEAGDALVEGERLLDLFKALDDPVEADSADLFDRVKTLVQARKLSANFSQFRRREILQDLPHVLNNNAHGIIASIKGFTPGLTLMAEK
jgi:hypothetical protein